MKGWLLDRFLGRRFDPAYSEGAASCGTGLAHRAKEEKNGNTFFFDGL
jgi:hypothetical protein